MNGDLKFMLMDMSYYSLPFDCSLWLFMWPLHLLFVAPHSLTFDYHLSGRMQCSIDLAVAKFSMTVPGRPPTCSRSRYSIAT